MFSSGVPGFLRFVLNGVEQFAESGQFHLDHISGLHEYRRRAHVANSVRKENVDFSVPEPKKQKIDTPEGLERLYSGVLR